MRAVIISRQGEPVASNVEVVDDWPEPRAVPGWLIVRTEASGLNYLDLYVGKGVPGLKLDYPRVPGADACGRVESVGQGVDPAWIGRRVVLNAAVPQPGPNHPDVLPAPPARRMIGEHDPGTHAEKFAAPATNVLDVGDGDAAEAAAYGLSHLTAWRMLVTRAGLRAGRTVLITGTSGGTAQALLNIARLFGCTTIVTSRRPTVSSTPARTGRARCAASPGSAAWMSAPTRWARRFTCPASRRWPAAGFSSPAGPRPARTR
ncbi:MAG: alcohol dehydrogenase catalytic domain-containing protein [Planctomycetota bacterium]|jgi:NADPH2:quinone reductase